MNIDFENSVKLHDLFDNKNKGLLDFAKKIGKSSKTVYKRFYLLVLPEGLQKAIEIKIDRKRYYRFI